MQVAAYARALEEMADERVEEAYVVNFLLRET